MLLDKEGIYSDDQELISSGASTNVIDHGPVENCIGSGEPLVVAGDLDIAASATNGDETYTVKLQGSDTEGFLSPTDLSGATVIPRGSPVGYKFSIPYPPSPTKQFTRLYYTLGGTDPHVMITAFQQPASMASSDSTVMYPSGWEVAS